MPSIVIMYMLIKLGLDTGIKGFHRLFISFSITNFISDFITYKSLHWPGL